MPVRKAKLARAVRAGSFGLSCSTTIHLAPGITAGLP